MAREITQLDVLKNAVVNDLFVKTADQTYVVARWCFLNRLYLDFYWNGLHAVEKYLKAALLLNGHSALGFSHNIERLYSAVEAFADEFLPEELLRPDQLRIDHWRNEATVDFVRRLNGLGDPNNRYNLFGFTQLPEDLYKLDRLVFAIRNVAQILDGYAFIGTHQNNGGPNFSGADLLRRAPEQAYHYAGSRLAELAGEKATSDVRQATLTHNIPFAPADHEHGALPSGASGNNAVLYRHVIRPAEAESPLDSDAVTA